MRRLYIPFFVKFIFVFICISTLPLLILSFQSSKLLRPILRTLYLELHTKTIEISTAKIRSYFETLSQILTLVESIVIRTDLPWSGKQTLLESLIDINPNIVSISILDTSGKEKIKIYNPEILTQPKLEDFSKTEFFVNFTKSGNKTEFLNFRSEDGIYRIDNFHKHQNLYIRIVVSLNPLFEQLKDIKIGKTGTITIISPSNHSIIFTNLTNKNVTESLLSDQIVKIAKQSVTVGSKEVVYNNIGYILSYMSLPFLDWIAILQQEQAEAYYISNLLIKRTTRLILFLLFISAFVSFVLATGISQPILKIVNAAKTVASGNFNVNIKIRTFDELEILGNTFNHMAQKLNEYAEIQLDKLIAEKTKTEAIIFSIRDGIILTDHNGTILLINKRAKDILQIKDTLENLNIFNILDERIKPVFESALREPNKIFELDLSKENYPEFYQTMALPVSTPKNEKIGIVTVLHDITLEKQIDKMKDDFIHSITHDLRNPMTSIRGFIKLLSDGLAGPINEQQKKMLDTMDRASFKLLNMINDILDVAKLEAGRMELNLEMTNLVKIVNSVLEVQQPLYERKNLKVTFIPQKEEIFILADPKLIERVYTNLIGNAIKFTPEGKSITIGIEEFDDSIQSYVQDTGEGIPKNYQEKIFEKFGQVENKAKGGTGLGLTICKYIIEAHKGKIWVESEVGHGAKFIFTLPKTQS
ncbi:MAG: ATP-binding protein [Endomicrobia bacterium]|nr:ATP-binding protein [Endomicrobiia bacterium]